MSIYTDIAEAVRETGGITVIGTAENAGETAIVYSGVNIIRKYMNGERIAELLFNLTGADTADRQKALIEKMCRILRTLRTSVVSVQGVQICSVDAAALPTPTVYDGRYWIYSASVKVTCRFNDRRSKT